MIFRGQSARHAVRVSCRGAALMKTRVPVRLTIHIFVRGSMGLPYVFGFVATVNFLRHNFNIVDLQL